MAPTTTGLSNESDITTPLLSFRQGRSADHNHNQNHSHNGDWTLSSSTRRLYISHFLSTCNSRVFEFGSVLYLASIFPGTLMPMSVYAVVRGASVILLSSLVGQHIDREDRLKVVRLSIVLQRLVVAASCGLFFTLAKLSDAIPGLRNAILALLVFMACIEKLASIMNLVSVERDWVVVIAGNDTTTLRSINSQMRRIDLVCKLFGPFLIGVLDGISTETAILVNLAMNCISVVIEYFSIAKVYHQVPELQRPKTTRSLTPEHNPERAQVKRWTLIMRAVKKSGKDLALYLRHPALMASLACALLYLTVLTFSGQMVTYLLAAGYTPLQVAATRTVSVTFEVLATWLAPWLIGRIGPVRAGLWFSSWQVICLTVGMYIFWKGEDEGLVSALGLVCGTILSRLGLWGFDLSTQLIVQDEVEEESRGAFSAVEASFQNVFEMCSYTMTVVLSSPDQFRWPATISVGATLCAWALYTRFVRKRRGHLIHWPACISHPEKRQRSTEDLLQEGIARRLRQGL
ncbi:Ferroporti-1 [Mariannaea sp. PMI_226]|nr:Ferroporti-1 [Mariannaea sp. PMI_226]